MRTFIVANMLVKCKNDPFPTIRARRTASFGRRVLHMQCPHTAEQMVAGNNCKNWYHVECIKMPVKKAQKWYCKNCFSLLHA